MASINGISLKNVKHFMGREGYGINADVYHNGKKLGFYLEEGNGGCSTFYPEKKGDTEILAKAEKEYFEKSGKEMMGYSEVGDNIVLELESLISYEKAFKKNTKKGFVAIGVKHLPDFEDKIYLFPKALNMADRNIVDEYFEKATDFVR